MNASKRTISDIFNGNRTIEIPFFQRAYVWEEDQWERLLDDMEHVSQNKKPYFLGSVILKQQKTPTNNDAGDIRTLIDGQQRLTTIIIFFKSLWLLAGHDSFFDGRFKLSQGKNKLALKHNHNDIESFEKISNLKEFEEIETDKETDKKDHCCPVNFHMSFI